MAYILGVIGVRSKSNSSFYMRILGPDTIFLITFYIASCILINILIKDIDAMIIIDICYKDNINKILRYLRT